MSEPTERVHLVTIFRDGLIVTYDEHGNELERHSMPQPIVEIWNPDWMCRISRGDELEPLTPLEPAAGAH